MKLWDELVRQGILGSQRQKLQLPEVPLPLAELLTNDPASSEEIRFLNASILLKKLKELKK